MLQELDASQAGEPQIRRYHYGTKVLAVTESAGTSYVLNDGLGSASDFWNSGGMLAKSRQYDPWGGYRNGTAPGSGEAKVGYTGHQFDPETGYFSVGPRVLDPALGIFLSRDAYEGVLPNAPSLHRYAYAWSNPLRWVDLTGYCTQGVDEGCELGLLDILGSAVRSATTDKTYAELTEEAKERNYQQRQQEQAADEDKGPSRWQRGVGWVVENVVEPGTRYVKESWAGKWVAGVDEAAKEAARDVGSDVVSRLDVTQGSTNQLYNEAPKYETARHLGGEIGELGYEGAKEGAKTYFGGKAVEMGVGLAAAATVEVAESTLKPIAIGLSRTFTHRENLVARFAEKVGATTYWQEYPGAIPSNNEILARMVTQFEQRAIKVNLSGLAQLPGKNPDIERGLRQSSLSR